MAVGLATLRSQLESNASRPTPMHPPVPPPTAPAPSVSKSEVIVAKSETPIPDHLRSRILTSDPLINPYSRQPMPRATSRPPPATPLLCNYPGAWCGGVLGGR
ncbi:hypothetical protein Pmani_018782 [Petrolisthes manimaculis]|uniref:Uncharacterized protein n=1 Tax=Petrolisthes manimaculis TaxID=1843537 RepID=A0AAE1U475_9EUCA|nr:hypothetical protein Pmani_018782 [Petrolisthes manimaculis]